MKVTEEFKGVVSREENGQIVVNLSNISPTEIVTIITGSAVQLRAPAQEQTNISSSPTAGAFNPANAVVEAGQVQLNKVSKYLADLPDTAKAELLVSPKDTAKIFDRAIGTFKEDTASIRTIGESHGIHHKGQVLTGMQIFDRPENAPDITYEEAWAIEVRAVWKKANASGKAEITGLAIGTKQIVSGREIDTRDVTVENNLYSCVDDINTALRAQGGQKIITQRGASRARNQFTATEHPDDRTYICCVAFTQGYDGKGRKGQSHLASRPVALRVLPPNL